MAVLTPQEKKSGVCLVDIGSGMTEIVIFHKGIVRHIAVLPFAGDAITADIEQGCGISTEYAEQLKVKFGCAVADEIDVVTGGCRRGDVDAAESKVYGSASVSNVLNNEIRSGLSGEVDNHKTIATRLGGDSQTRGVVDGFEDIVGVGCKSQVDFAASASAVGDSDLATSDSGATSQVVGRRTRVDKATGPNDNLASLERVACAGEWVARSSRRLGGLKRLNRIVSGSGGACGTNGDHVGLARRSCYAA